MAIPKVCGIETEYGIIRTSGESNPILASSYLVNAYVQTLGRRRQSAGWDFEDEMPGNDARGYTAAGALPPEVETNLVNAVLSNGARFYVDHAHPEYSSPECRDALQATLYDLAGEQVLLRAMAAARATLPPSTEIVVYKNNSDGKGNSYGCHENYLLDRTLPFAKVVAHITPFFVTRQIFTGAGKVGYEAPGVDGPGFQITQRADFFEEEVGLETTLKRPIVNTRDEPHADATRFRRLHVIVGDANLSAVQTFLKLGTTSIVLAMIEDGVLPNTWSLAAPVQAMRQVSYDLSLKQALTLADGTSATPLDLQFRYLEAAEEWAKSRGLASVGEEVGERVLALWREVLETLQRDPLELADTLDWVAKLRAFDAYRGRHQLEWRDARMRLMDLQYHDLRAEKSLSRRLGLRTLFEPGEIVEAVSEPPHNTRAYFRGKALSRFGDSVAAANWDSVVFDLGVDPLRRVPMMDPLRGTKELVGTLLEESKTPAELLARLGA